MDRRPSRFVVSVLSALVLLTTIAVPAQARSEGGLSACDYASSFRDIPCGEVNRAITEAAQEFRIDEGRFRRMIRCESKFNPFVGTKYKGLTQANTHPGGYWSTQVPRFNAAVNPDVTGNVLAPFDNARVAARVISQESYRQWSCKG